MKLDQWGIYRDNTASDSQDACRLAGIMNAIRHPGAQWLLPFVTPTGEIMRHPHEHIYNISRDQVVCFVAGYHFRLSQKACKHDFSDRYKWRISKDIVSPSVYNHIRMCEGKPSTWLGRHWLTIDMWYNAKFCDANTEQNQIIMLALVAGRLKEYCEMTPWWKESLRRYWGDRQEHEFVEYYIKYIEHLVTAT